MNTTPHPDQLDLSTCRTPAGSPVVANSVMEKGCMRERGRFLTAYGVSTVPTSADQHAECWAACGRQQAGPFAQTIDSGVRTGCLPGGLAKKLIIDIIYFSQLVGSHSQGSLG